MRKIPTEKILGDLKFLSVNQLNAESKLQEVWKSINNSDYPIKWEKNTTILDSRTRSVQKNTLIFPRNGIKMQATFYSDYARLWNIAPDTIKNCKTLFCAKKEIRHPVVVAWW